MPKKKSYTSSNWSYTKPPEDDRRKLTLFVAGAVPSNLTNRLDQLTLNYDVVTVMCAGNTDYQGHRPKNERETEMERTIREWAVSRRQNADVIPLVNLGIPPGWLQFMGPDGNKAAIVYDDGICDGSDVRFAEKLGREEDIQFRKVKIQRDVTKDFTAAVASISETDTGLKR